MHNLITILTDSITFFFLLEFEDYFINSADAGDKSGEPTTLVTRIKRGNLKISLQIY